MANVLDILCPELIVEIFSHLEIRDLGRVASVSKRFKELAYSKRLWKNVEFIDRLEYSIDEDVIRSLVQKGIRRLHIVPSEQDMKLPDFWKLLPELEYLSLNLLHLDHSPVDRVHDVTLDIDFSAVRRLSLEFYWYSSDKANSKQKAFLEQFSNVEVLSWCFSVHEDVSTKCYDGLKMIFGKLKCLRKLHIGFPITSAPFRNVQFHQCKTLEGLSMDMVDFDGITLRDVGQCFPKLGNLRLFCCTYVGFDLVGDCGKNLGHLQELEFHFCKNVRKVDVVGIKKCAKHINMRYTDIGTGNKLKT